MAAWMSRDSRSSTFSSVTCARNWRRRRAAAIISRQSGAADTCCVSRRPTTTASRHKARGSRIFRQLPRQDRRPHQSLVDRRCALAAFADRPNDQRLAAPHIATGEDLRAGGGIPVCVGVDVPSLVQGHTELRQHAFLDWRNEAHRQELEVRSEDELGSLDGLELLVDARASEPGHDAILAFERDRGHRKIALGALLVARRGAQLKGPVWPGKKLVLCFGRHRHDLELSNLERSLAEWRADADGSGVAAANAYNGN